MECKTLIYILGSPDTSSPLGSVFLLQKNSLVLNAVINKTLVSTPSSLDGYSPRNQKLRTYPFMYLGYNPFGGSQKIYRYENFANGTPSFDLISEVNPNPSVYLVPKNYRGGGNSSIGDAVSFGGYPLVANKNDNFNIWVAQNRDIVRLQAEHEENQYNMNQMGNLINGSLALAGNIATGNVGGALASAGNTIMQGLSTQENHEYFIKNQMAQIEKQKMLPDNVTQGGSNATLLGYGLMDTNIFTRYTIKAQFAERIDKYFDMYGYLTNKLKLPNLNNRPKWNYIKTVGANILGNIPQIDLQEIRTLFDNGITLWHDSSTFLDYSQNNRS